MWQYAFLDQNVLFSEESVIRPEQHIRGSCICTLTWGSFVLLFMVKSVFFLSHIWHTLTIKLRTEFCASQQGSSYYILNVQVGLWTYWSSLILTYNNMNSSYNLKSYLLLGSSRSWYSSAWCRDTPFVLEYGVCSVVSFQLCVPNLISQIKEKPIWALNI